MTAEPTPRQRCLANQAAAWDPDDVMYCGRCGHATDGRLQGHWWGHCDVTGTTRATHFCCPGSCELEAAAEPDPRQPCHPDPGSWDDDDDETEPEDE